MKRFHLDLGQRLELQQSYSDYDPDAIRELLESIAWQQEQESSLEFQEHPSEADLGLPKNLLTSDSYYFPQRYEKNYAYPLIIWLTTGEPTLQSLMPRLSDQNYLGLEISIDSFTKKGSSNGSSNTVSEKFWAHLQEEIEDFQQQANIHPDRIFLAGKSQAACLAIQTALLHPLHFAGFLAIDPVDIQSSHSLTNFRLFRHLKGFITTTKAKPNSENDRGLKPFAQLLHDAGIEILLNTQKKTESKALNQMNHFIMNAITGSRIIK